MPSPSFADVRFPRIQGPSTPRRRPNIVLIVPDDVGADHAPFAGFTPRLDARARGGLWIPRYTSAPTCSPARASIMTGLMPARHGIGTASGVTTLSPSKPALARELCRLGYRSAAIGKWHVFGALEDGAGLRAHVRAMGFEYFEGVRQNIPSYTSYTWFTDDGSSSTVTTYNTQQVTDRALAYLDTVDDDPFFLYVCYNAAHSPFHCPPASYGVSCGGGTDLEHYRAALRVLDIEMDRLVSALDLTNTAVFVAGDNGSPDQVIQNYPTDQAKFTPFLGGIRTPFVAFGEGVRSGETSGALVCASDLAATFLELAGGTAPASMVDSVSFAEVLGSATATTGRSYGYAEGFLNSEGPSGSSASRSAEDARYHLVRQMGGSESLFDVVNDPFELEPLSLSQLSAGEAASFAALDAVLDSFGAIH